MMMSSGSVGNEARALPAIAVQTANEGKSFMLKILKTNSKRKWKERNEIGRLAMMLLLIDVGGMEVRTRESDLLIYEWVHLQLCCLGRSMWAGDAY